jgi:trigger factor
VNIKVEALENNQVKLSFEVDAKDVDARIKRTYRNVAKRYSFPGFRPGKAPRPVIDNIMGLDAVRTTVTEDLVNEVYPQALEENNLVPLQRPDYQYEQELVEDHKPFNFTATIQLKPELELSSYEPVEVEVPSTDATAEEIDAQIEELRNYYHDFKDANANTKVKPGEFVELSMSAKNEKGEEVGAFDADHRLYELGQGVYPEAFDAELIGLKKGGEKSFDLDLTDMHSAVTDALEEKGTVHFEVTIDAIKKKIVPEVTEEWAKETFGFEGLEDMRSKIADSIKTQKTSSMGARKENECLLALGNRIEGDLPEAMLERQETENLQNFYGQLSRMGLTFDKYLSAMDMTPDQFKEDNKKQAADMVRQDLALDAWARHYEITATEEEVHNEFAQADLDDPEAIMAEWRKEGRLPMIRESIVRTNAVRDVVAKAKVTEVEVSKEEEAE